MSYGGGGFFANGNEGSQSNGASKKPVKTVRTLMISQINAARLDNADGPVLVDDHPAESAVLCGIVQSVEDANNAKRLKVWDSSGSAQLRLSNFRNPGDDDEPEDPPLNRYANIYGYFRIFNGKHSFEISRLDFEIQPYQFLYHEVLAAREWYHFSGLLQLGDKIEAKSGAADATNGTKKEEESLFVADNGRVDDDLKQRILGIVAGIEENEEGAPQEWIARELAMDEAKVEQALTKMVELGSIYEIDGNYRVI